MRKSLGLALCALFVTIVAGAQSKVFKEVNDEISSKVMAIKQDDALVGYLVFAQLEKANEDSFNYKITLMDENLNDIGKVNFREQQLDLQAVSFDQDVLCLGYFRSNTVKNSGKNARRVTGKIDYAVLTQFLNLEGKILKTNVYVADVKYNPDNLNSAYYITGNVYNRYGVLKHRIQLRNIPQKGFACFYGDEKANNLITYNSKGEQQWKKKITEAEHGFSMLTSSTGVYLLSKQKVEDTPEGGFELQGYDVADSSSYAKFSLKDKQGNYLKVLDFQNDPVTGKPYLAGNIINPDMSMKYIKARHIAKGAYSGVFTLNINGREKSDIKEIYTYWNDGSQDGTISKKGLYTETGGYAQYYESIRDFQGNTYFVGSSFIKRARVGAIISSVIFSPIIFYPPFQLGIGGTSKCKIKDAILLKQTPSGVLTVDNTVVANNTGFYISKLPLSYYEKRSFYSVNNNETKTNYLIIDDAKDIVIYNINQKKVARTVSHKDGNIMTNIFPAKEGHIMVSEYNKKEKYSKLSIESL